MSSQGSYSSDRQRPVRLAARSRVFSNASSNVMACVITALARRIGHFIFGDEIFIDGTIEVCEVFIRWEGGVGRRPTLARVWARMSVVHFLFLTTTMGQYRYDRRDYMSQLGR